MIRGRTDVSGCIADGDAEAGIGIRGAGWSSGRGECGLAHPLEACGQRLQIHSGGFRGEAECRKRTDGNSRRLRELVHFCCALGGVSCESDENAVHADEQRRGAERETCARCEPSSDSPRRSAELREFFHRGRCRAAGSLERETEFADDGIEIAERAEGLLGHFAQLAERARDFLRGLLRRICSFGKRRDERASFCGEIYVESCPSDWDIARFLLSRLCAAQLGARARLRSARVPDANMRNSQVFLVYERAALAFGTGGVVREDRRLEAKMQVSFYLLRKTGFAKEI